ncbi:MAG: hypothetical protein ABI693_12865 [Bryobacteraceae bacterium]
MKIRLLPLTLLLVTGSFASSMHNRDVIRMVKEGAPVSDIITRINSSDSGFPLYPEDVRSLRANAVPELVINAMNARNINEPLPIPDLNPSIAAFARKPRNTVRGVELIVESTPVRLRLSRNVSSAYARTNDIIHFEVLEDVVVKNHVGKFLVVERGAPAWGTITETAKKRRLGRAGTLQMTIDFVRLANGDKMALRATVEGDRHGHVGLIVGLMVPTAVVSLPATPFWLFMHGKDSTIKSGFDFTAMTDGVANLDSAEFEQR